MPVAAGVAGGAALVIVVVLLLILRRRRARRAAGTPSRKHAGAGLYYAGNDQPLVAPSYNPSPAFVQAQLNGSYAYEVCQEREPLLM